MYVFFSIDRQIKNSGKMAMRQSFPAKTAVIFLFSNFGKQKHCTNRICFKGEWVSEILHMSICTSII